MSEQFFERPILNSPYEYPARHWELDEDGQPTTRVFDVRRRSELITPVPKPKKQRRRSMRTRGPAAPHGRLPISCRCHPAWRIETSRD